MNVVRAGDVIADRFEIERRAAAGGMGAIYRARDRTSGAVVALKVLHGAKDRDAERFAREARILADLKHPGLVRYVAHGVAEGGVGYLAMEWLEGQVLNERFLRGTLTVSETMVLARRIADALAVAHERGVIHRDIKPDNLFLPGGDIDAVKVIDFGIARFGRSPSLITGVGIMIGTPRYMAPEQARGTRDLDARTDIFALGCVMYECLTGLRAFPGDDVLAVLAKVLLDDAPRVRESMPSVPRALDDLICRMMSKEPSLRPTNGADIAAQLAALDEPHPPAVPAVGSPRSLLTRGERRFVSVVVVASPMEVDVLETVAQTDWEVNSEVNERLSKTVAAYGARFEALADGSRVVTLIGQRSPTDQAAQAARCALAVRLAVRDVPMVLASGHGEVAGRLPFGDVVDGAVRTLHQEIAADPRRREQSIRIDDVTAGLLDARFAMGGDERGLILRGEREMPEATRTLLGKPTPCVGRERELLTLEGLFAECQAESVARGMLVTAAPGVGKSRLRHEFLNKVRASYDTTEIWISRGDPMSAGSPFGMLAQSIRRAAGCLQGEALVTQQKKLRARVARHLSGPTLPRVTEFIGELLGIPYSAAGSMQLRAARSDPRLMGDQMLRAWEEFLAAECAGSPLVLVLEDLHWGDLPSVQFIDAALRTLHDRPFMVLALARPEVTDLFPQLWKDRGIHHMRLGDLTKRASHKLARQALGQTVEDAKVDELVLRAAGNAFYLEELIRAVADGSQEVLPATVMAMVQVRLARLGAELRRVLRAASVFGAVFWRGGLAELLGYADRMPELDAKLRALIDQEVITTRGEGRFPGDEELVFRHAIMRDAVYGMLTAEDAEVGHRLAGAWLEEVGESEAVILAEHFERGAEPARAVDWYRQAAEQALEGNDFEAAHARAERGVLCGAEGDVLGRMRLLQAQSREWRGKHAEAKTCGLSALTSLTAHSQAWFVAAGEVAIASGRAGDFETLTAVATSLIDVPEAARIDGEHVIACARATLQLLLAGRHHAERVSVPVLVQRMEASAASFSERDSTVVAQVNMARALQAHLGGDPAEARRLSAAAVVSFETAGDLRQACMQRLNVGYFAGELGAYRQAEVELKEALVIAERMGLRTVITAAKHNLGLVVARQGRTGEGLELESFAIETALEQGDPRLVGGSRIYRAKILLLAGEIAEAAEEALRAVDVCQGSPPGRAKALSTLAQVRLAQSRTTDALAAATEAHEILGSLGGVDGDEEAIRLAYAEALHAAGDRAAARAAIATACERLRSRAADIRDPSWRQSFLENVPENARTLALMEAWSRSA